MLSKVKFLTFYIAILLFAAVLIRVYIPSNALLYFITFVTSAFLFYQSISAFGYIVREQTFKCNLHELDFPLGLGSFCFFLNIWFKQNSSIVFPFVILFSALLFSIYSKYKQRKHFGWTINNICNKQNFFVGACYLLLVFVLLWYGSGDGLLLFPLDFDSGMLHVALPKKWIVINEITAQKYMRGPFIGQFLHVLYYFLLKIFNNNEAYLKIINLCSFTSFFVICTAIGNRLVHKSYFGVFIPIILVLFYDTREYLTSTNLDAVFSLLMFAGSMTVYLAILNKNSKYLLLGTLLLAFSAGLKHFGFLLSAPLLSICYVYYLITPSFYKSFQKKLKVAIFGFSIFLTVSLSFYLHNLLQNNSILFPFIGSTENTYGWSLDEIKGFHNIIGLWGVHTDLMGFFTLICDIPHFPDKFQFSIKGHGISDYFYSFSILCAFSIIPLSLLSFPRKKYITIIPVIITIIQLFLWYKGSQVVRYLLPIVSLSLFIFTWLSYELIFPRLHDKLKTTIPIALVFICGIYITKVHSNNLSIPVTVADKQDLIQKRYGDTHSMIQYLRQRNIQDPILFVGDSSYSQFMTDLKICGDWFGPCRWGDVFDIAFSNDYLRFKSIKDSKSLLKTNNIKWIVLNWTTFLQQKRPQDIRLAIEDIQCYSFEKQIGNVDLIKINENCLN